MSDLPIADLVAEMEAGYHETITRSWLILQYYSRERITAS